MRTEEGEGEGEGVEYRNGTRSFGTLLRELAEGGATLVRKEIALARLEASDLATSVGRGTGFTAAGAVLLLLGGLATFTGIVLLAGLQWMREQVWLAALIFAVVAAIVALVLARRGFALLRPERLAPDQTVETLRENKEWLKRQRTSGATSR